MSADTPPSERVYYRSTHTGQRGYLVDTPEGPKIRHDSLRHVKIVAFDRTWQSESIRPDINRMQAAQVAYAADRSLARWLGDAIDSRKDWANLDDDDRIDFAENGPDQPGKRQVMFAAIMQALGCENP